MRTESRGTQTNLVSGMNESLQLGEAVGVPAGQLEQDIQTLYNPQSAVNSNPQQPIIQANNQQNCEQTTSSTMRVFVIVATFFMGLFDLIAYIFSGIKRLISSPALRIFETKCNKHHPNDLYMDCLSCQQMKQLPGRKFNVNECAICFNPIKNKVFFSCQHSCCAECTVENWERNNYKKMKCIFCRQPVDMIYRDFKANGDNRRTELRKIIRSYNSTFAPKDRSLLSKIRDSPFLLKRTINFAFTREGVMYMLGHVCSSRFFIVGLLYIISPLDLLPECIFGIFGLFDDIVVMGILFVLLTNFYYRYLLRQDQENSSSDQI